MSLFNKVFHRANEETAVRKEWDLEKKLDSDLDGRGYNFPDSVAIAIDFFFRARLLKLPDAEQSLICIDSEQASVLCEYVYPDRIESELSGRHRVVYFGTRNDGDIFRVVLCQRKGQEWRVVGFHYPRDAQGHYYAVFEPHYYWFAWRDESGYLSPLVNPDY